MKFLLIGLSLLFSLSMFARQEFEKLVKAENYVEAIEYMTSHKNLYSKYERTQALIKILSLSGKEENLNLRIRLIDKLIQVGVDFSLVEKDGGNFLHLITKALSSSTTLSKSVSDDLSKLFLKALKLGVNPNQVDYLGDNVFELALRAGLYEQANLIFPYTSVRLTTLVEVYSHPQNKNVDSSKITKELKAKLFEKGKYLLAAHHQEIFPLLIENGYYKEVFLSLSKMQTLESFRTKIFKELFLQELHGHRQSTGRTLLMKKLISSGIDINYQDETGETLLHKLFDYEKFNPSQLVVIDMILKDIFSLNPGIYIKDYKGRSIFGRAVALDVSAVSLLIKHSRLLQDFELASGILERGEVSNDLKYIHWSKVMEVISQSNEKLGVNDIQSRYLQDVANALINTSETMDEELSIYKSSGIRMGWYRPFVKNRPLLEDLSFSLDDTKVNPGLKNKWKNFKDKTCEKLISLVLIF
jgi:ankyrin repeat protein